MDYTGQNLSGREILYNFCIGLRLIYAPRGIIVRILWFYLYNELMNLYIRYFDEECVVSSAEEAFDFLSSLPGITLDEAFVKDLRQYMDSPMPYPKRYKVRPRVYFIVIKTTATTWPNLK